MFGSALKASVGKGGSSAASPSGGGTATTPSTGTNLTPDQNLNKPSEPNTQVQVVIQGDILDSDESGSRIVDLINQAFNKKGVVIQNGVMA